MGRCSSAAAASSGSFRTAVPSAAACRSAASSRRATAWVRLRTPSWFAGEAGSKVSRRRAASRNEARAQLGLHPLQLRRAAGRQQRADRREQHRPRQGRRQAAAAHLEPRRLDLDRAEQRLQPARAPVLERLQRPASWAGPAKRRMFRHLAAQHARLQLGQQRLGFGQHEADLRKPADHRRPAERRQLRRRHLPRACPRLQPHRPLHHARRPRGQASDRLISPRQASRLPQAFDTPQRRPKAFLVAWAWPASAQRRTEALASKVSYSYFLAP